VVLDQVVGQSGVLGVQVRAAVLLVGDHDDGRQEGVVLVQGAHEFDARDAVQHVVDQDDVEGVVRQGPAGVVEGAHPLHDEFDVDTVVEGRLDEGRVVVPVLDQQHAEIIDIAHALSWPATSLADGRQSGLNR